MLTSSESSALDRAQRAALRALLVRAVVAADHVTDSNEQMQLARTAPVEHLVSAAAIHRGARTC